jgi:hypothetical protein
MFLAMHWDYVMHCYDRIFRKTRNMYQYCETAPLKGHGNEANFLGFLHKPVRYTGPLHYVLSRSDFSFEFSEMFIIEKLLPDSPSRGVDKIAYRLIGTLTDSRPLSACSRL